MAGANRVVIDGVSYPIDDATAVDFEEQQTLTDAQKARARSNIGAASQDDMTSVQAAVGNVPSGSNLQDEVTDLKSAVNDIAVHMPVSTAEIFVSDFSAIQYMINNSTGKWTGNANAKAVLIPLGDVDKITVVANADTTATIAFLKDNSHTSGDIPNYATGCSKETIAAGRTKTYNVPSDATYLYVFKSYTPTTYAPQHIYSMTYIDVPTVDDTLTQSGKSADAKVTGDEIKSIKDTVGKVVTANFVKPTTGNAVVNFAYPVVSGEIIKFYWTGEDITSSSSLNLYSRETSTGSNLETLITSAHANNIYDVTPTVNANYLRVSATRTGTIYVFGTGTVIDDINILKKDVAQLNEEVAELGENLGEIPFVQFGFVHDMYDPSTIFGESGEIGNINEWSSKAEALEKVHAAFDALCASGGAGYGYGERITGLYKENASDEAILDLIAPDYVTQGVSQGQTVDLPIGTDTGGNLVTYNYEYESSTQPYEVRLYRFHDTNSALHTESVDIPKRKILLVGGTHGNEFCAPINLYVLAKHLCSDYTNPDILKLRSSFDVYIIPYLNGFGCQYRWNNNGTISVGTRGNGRLVDINRNCYTAGWSGASGTAEQITAYFEDKIANLATNTFPGYANGSEFESSLVKGLIEYLQPDVFIDHHHNSGNAPFYTTCRGDYAGNLVYQAANDSAYARMHNMPEYFGTKYNLFLGSDVSPATKAAANGHMQTMAYELGVKMNAVSEMPESIAYLNGVVDSATKSATKFSALAFKQAEYTLLNVALHFCQWAMEH